MIGELRQAYDDAEADDDVWIIARHRERACVLRRRRRQRDPRRRAGRLRRAVPLDVRAVGGAAGRHAAVPHDDQADPRRGQRPVLRRRARLGHHRRHRDRVGPGRVLRSAREHRPGVGARDGAARARAADQHRHADRAHGPPRAHERGSARTSSGSSPRSSSTTACSNGRGRSRRIVNRNAPLAVRGTRLAIRRGLDLPMHEAEIMAETFRERVVRTDDAKEGPQAFVEKREPVWRCR